MGTRRWALAAAFVAGTATAALLGAALAETDTGRPRTLVGLGLGAFIIFVVAGGLWVSGIRRGPSDAVVERAETASKLAHELKNPLMAIKGLASTGASLFDRMEDEERKEFFRLIDEEAGRLKRVADQSATALRVDAEQLEYELREENLGTLVEEVAWATSRAEHPIAVDSEPGITVQVDRRYLGEALENLLDNAVKFSPPDAPIDVSVRQNDRQAVIEVADRGPGIPPDRLGHVFERFGRWRPAGYEETPGSGLGLFIARAHVLAHGGRIDVDEREDGGSILRVTLPAKG